MFIVQKWKIIYAALDVPCCWIMFHRQLFGVGGCNRSRCSKINHGETNLIGLRPTRCCVRSQLFKQKFFILHEQKRENGSEPLRFKCRQRRTMIGRLANQPVYWGCFCFSLHSKAFFSFSCSYQASNNQKQAAHITDRRRQNCSARQSNFCDWLLINQMSLYH